MSVSAFLSYLPRLCAISGVHNKLLLVAVQKAARLGRLRCRFAAPKQGVKGENMPTIRKLLFTACYSFLLCGFVYTFPFLGEVINIVLAYMIAIQIGTPCLLAALTLMLFKKLGLVGPWYFLSKFMPVILLLTSFLIMLLSIDIWLKIEPSAGPSAGGMGMIWIIYSPITFAVFYFLFRTKRDEAFNK